MGSRIALRYEAGVHGLPRLRSPLRGLCSLLGGLIPPTTSASRTEVSRPLCHGRAPLSPGRTQLIGVLNALATEEPCVPTLASDSSDYDFGYNFKISDMSTIMKDKGLRPALGG